MKLQEAFTGQDIKQTFVSATEDRFQEAKDRMSEGKEQSESLEKMTDDGTERQGANIKGSDASKLESKIAAKAKADRDSAESTRDSNGEVTDGMALLQRNHRLPENMQDLQASTEDVSLWAHVQRPETHHRIHFSEELRKRIDADDRGPDLLDPVYTSKHGVQPPNEELLAMMQNAAQPLARVVKHIVGRHISQHVEYQTRRAKDPKHYDPKIEVHELIRLVPTDFDGACQIFKKIVRRSGRKVFKELTGLKGLRCHRTARQRAKELAEGAFIQPVTKNEYERMCTFIEERSQVFFVAQINHQTVHNNK